MAATDLHQLALNVLAKAEEILATTTNGPPDFAYVTHGPPALDCCNQVAVNVSAIGEAPTLTPGVLDAGLRHKTGRVNLTAITITQTRCWSAGLSPTRPPLTSEQEAAAAGLNEDGWALWNGLYRATDLFDGCDLVFFDGMVPLEPQGGCAGWTFVIRFQLGGYDPLGGS